MNKFVIKLKKGSTDQLYSPKIKDRRQTQPLLMLPRSERTVELYKHINDLSPYAVH